MLPEQRRARLLDHLGKEGLASVPELSQSLQVSSATVRRDLKILEKGQLLRRTHGGAILIGRHDGNEEPLHQEKVQRYLRHKRAIARLAASLVEDGSVVALDSGSTTLALAYELRKKRNLTVITTDLKIAIVLADARTIDVIVVGGTVRTQLYTVVGPIAEETLMKLNCQIGFMGADAINQELGVTNANLAEVAVKRLVLGCSERTYLLADHSKFDQTQLAAVARLTEFAEIITDDEINYALVERYQASGARLTLAPMEN